MRETPLCLIVFLFPKVIKGHQCDNTQHVKSKSSVVVAQNKKVVDENRSEGSNFLRSISMVISFSNSVVTSSIIVVNPTNDKDYVHARNEPCNVIKSISPHSVAWLVKLVSVWACGTHLDFFLSSIQTERKATIPF
jgi:hypothetical protein